MHLEALINQTQISYNQISLQIHKSLARPKHALHAPSDIHNQLMTSVNPHVSDGGLVPGSIRISEVLPGMDTKERGIGNDRPRPV